MVKLMLNLHKFNNYAFFCPVSKVHLTVSSPVGYTNEVTPAILKAVKAETVLDVDGVIDLETGNVDESKSTVKKAPKEIAPTPKEEAIVSPIEDTESKEVEAPVEEAPAEVKEEAIIEETPKATSKKKRAKTE